MTLEEALKKFNNNEIVSIGSLSAYIYIGPAGDLKKIEKYFKKYKAKVQLKLVKLKNKLVNSKKEKTLINERIASMENYLLNYKEPMSREVVSIYKKIDYGYSIIITGEEKGDCWLIEEMKGV